MRFVQQSDRRILRLLGGEVVTPRLEIAPYMTLASDLGKRLILSTNGYACEVWKNDLLSPNSFGEIIVSCYGLKKSHEAMTRIPGSFDRTLKTIEFLAANSERSHELTVNTLITPDNLREFLSFLRMLAALHVDEVKILTLSPLGFGGLVDRGGFHKSYVPPPERESVREQISDELLAQNLGDMRVVWEASELGGATTLLSTSLPRCRIHMEGMLTVDSKGYCYPCHLMIHQPELSIGNLNSRRLDDILQDLKLTGGAGALESKLLRKYGSCPAYACYDRDLPRSNKFKPDYCPMHLELLEPT